MILSGANMGIGRNKHPGAGGPIEHSGWNLKLSAAQVTAKNNAIRHSTDS
jgi:hypothetical protein